MGGGGRSKPFSSLPPGIKVRISMTIFRTSTEICHGIVWFIKGIVMEC
jgi:hypothetical protein